VNGIRFLVSHKYNRACERRLKKVTQIIFNPLKMMLLQFQSDDVLLPGKRGYLRNLMLGKLFMICSLHATLALW